jgi:hypothetical protein
MNRDPMADALKIDAALRRRMREVRGQLRPCASLDELQAAWAADLQCQSLWSESNNAWDRVWGRAL